MVFDVEGIDGEAGLECGQVVSMEWWSYGVVGQAETLKSGKLKAERILQKGMGRNGGIFLKRLKAKTLRTESGKRGRVGWRLRARRGGRTAVHQGVD
jgi:hypothetical protein